MLTLTVGTASLSVILLTITVVPATHSFNVLTRAIATATFIVIMLTMSFKVLLTVATAILDVDTNII